MLFFITYPQRYARLKNCYTIIEARNEGEARDIAFKYLGGAWAFIYEGEEELNRQIKMFGLKLIALGEAANEQQTSGGE